MVLNIDHDPSFHVRSPSLEYENQLKVAVDIYFCCPFCTKYHRQYPSDSESQT